MTCYCINHNPHFNLGRLLGLAAVPDAKMKDYRALAAEIEKARADHEEGRCNKDDTGGHYFEKGKIWCPKSKRSEGAPNAKARCPQCGLAVACGIEGAK